MENLVSRGELYEPFGRSLVESSCWRNKRETWRLVEAYAEDGSVIPGLEDELYFVDNLVVWSRGQGGSGCHLMKSYRVDEQVIDVFWCKFSGGVKTTDLSLHGGDHSDEELQLSPQTPCLCVVQHHSLCVFSMHGSNFSFMLPFAVRKAWPVPGGILLHSDLSQGESERLGRSDFPKLFFLVHPLDEVKPLAWRDPGESLEKCRTVVALLHDMEPVHAFADVPLILLKESKASGKFALYRMELLPAKKVLAASELDIGCADLGPVFATLKEDITPSLPSSKSTASDVSLSASTTAAVSAAASPLHLALHTADPTLSSQTMTSSLSPAFSPGTSTLASVRGSAQRRRSMTQLRRRLQSTMTSSTTAPGSATGSVVRSRDLGDAASPLPLLRGPSRTTGNRRSSRQPTTSSAVSRAYSSVAASVASSPMARTSRGAWTTNSSFMSASRHQSSLSTAMTPTRSPGCGIYTPAAYTRALGLNLPFTPIAMATAADSGSSTSKIYMDACVSLAWMDVRHAVSDSPVSASFTYQSVCGQMYACFMQRDVRKLTYMPILADGLVTGVTHTIDDVTDVVALNGLGLLCVAVSNGMRFQTACTAGDTFSEPLSSDVELHDVVASALSVVNTSTNQWSRLLLPNTLTNPQLAMCVDMLKQCLAADIFSKFSLHFYTQLTLATTTSSNASLLSTWQCFRTALCSILQLQCMPSDAAAMDATAGSLACDDDHLISAVCAMLDDGVPTSSLPSSLLFRTSPPPESCLHSLAAVFQRLHLVYEESKLDLALSMSPPYLLYLLASLAYALQLPEYVRYYMIDKPALANTLVPFVHPNPVSYKHVPQAPVSIAQYINTALSDSGSSSSSSVSTQWPSNAVCQRTTVLCDLISARRSFLHRSKLTTITSGSLLTNSSNPLQPESGNTVLDMRLQLQMYEQLASDIAASGLTECMLKSLPIGFRTPVEQMLEWCRLASLSSIPLSVCRLLDRTDLLRQSQLSAQSELAQPPLAVDQLSTLPADEIADGLRLHDPHLQLLFPKDRRVGEVCALLESVRPVLVTVEQKHGVSDHDHQQEQVEQLVLLLQRTCAQAVGRGAAALRSSRALPTEPLHVPCICTTGRTPQPRSMVVKLPDDHNLEVKWPLFHNGVASGLALSGQAVDAKWILHNRPQEEHKQHEHGGFLFALGLNNHLRALHKNQLYDYLTQLNVATTVGLLLGVASMRCASRHLLTLRLLSLHIGALRPPNSQLVKVEPLIQIAAIHGIGLLFMESANQHLCTICLQQIAGLPENADLKELKKFERRSYSLACGVAVGMMLLGQGQGQTVQDLQITSTLLAYLDATDCKVRYGQTAVETDAVKSLPPTAVGENGDARTALDGLMLNATSFDVHSTAPAASMALMLMYLKTNSLEAAHWLLPPFTAKQLVSVRPDVLLLRTAGHHLVMWDSIQPSREWFDSHYEPFKSFPHLPASMKASNDYYAALSHCCYAFQAGLCLAIGLRYAGSQSETAFMTIMDAFEDNMPLFDPSKCPEDRKRVFLMSMLVMLLSMAMVMAGTGDVRVLRICRLLHSHTAELSFGYGCHMATHMALGFVFLGGARHSFSRSNRAIASLLCAVYPIFPSMPGDNSCHLQALRHLYVLAAEPRLLAPVDADTEEACSIPILIKLKDGNVIETKAPSILPHLEDIEMVQTNSPLHWPVCLNFSHNFDNCRRTIQEHRGIVFVKRKPALQKLPYHISETTAFAGLSQSFRKVAASYVLDACDSSKELELPNSTLTAHQIVTFLHEKTFLPSLYSFMLKVLEDVKARRCLDCHVLQQLRLIFTASTTGHPSLALLDSSVVSVVQASVDCSLRHEEREVADALIAFLEHGHSSIGVAQWPVLSAVLLYHMISTQQCQQLQALLATLLSAKLPAPHLPLSLLAAILPSST